MSTSKGPLYTADLMYDKYFLPANVTGEYYRLDIRPGGYLTAIMTTKTGKNAPDLPFRLIGHGQPVEDPFYFVQFTVQRMFPSGGTWFDPIPNLNASYPYTLLVPPWAPELEVISVDRRQAI